MLQQTPASRVQGVWTEWLQRWPVPSALANDSAANAVRAWGRLGYPRRALRLHECATAIADRFGDRVPDEVETLQTLPGIGAYTARAVAVFAYGRREAPVDVNVRRVLARAFDGEGDCGPATKKHHFDQLLALLPEAARDASQVAAAVMELGATVCVARAPRCDDCPLLATCRWRAVGYPAAAVAKRVQRYEGTDRQVRGRLLAVLRDTPGAVSAEQLATCWDKPAQRERALASLVADGLARHVPSGYALADQHVHV